MNIQRTSVFVSLISVLLPIAGGCSALGSPGSTTYTTPPGDTYAVHSFDLAIDDTSAASKIDGAQVSSGFFGATGAQPILGRTTTPADFVVGSVRPVVILSYDLWAQRFASDPAIIGRNVMLDGHLTVIVGVMPKGFSVPSGASVWTPR